MRLFSLDVGGSSARIGRLTLGGNKSIDTPGLITYTHRGLVPHISPDHIPNSSSSWIHVPFESFLEQTPPIPRLLSGPNSLHSLLGFSPDKHIISLSLRDPTDMRRMPPNGNTHVAAMSLRGVRKVTLPDWAEHVAGCQPDVVFALSDTPVPPTATNGTEISSASFSVSQKRLTKSIERSTTWLSNLLTSFLPASNTPHVFVHLAGLASHAARKAFASSLLEPLAPSDPLTLATADRPGFPNLDAGIVGYTVDLDPLRLVVGAEPQPTKNAPAHDRPQIGSLTTQTHLLAPLLLTSLSLLPPTKPRLVTGTRGPHEILLLIRDVGVDLVDAKWAVDAASWGVALDFEFPINEKEKGKRDGKRDLGHNLYDIRYRLDFGPFCDRDHDASQQERELCCLCGACSPTIPRFYSPSPSQAFNEEEKTTESVVQPLRPPHTRAYTHHLLHTHEMSAHTLLTMHNLHVVQRFLDGVRSVILRGSNNSMNEQAPSDKVNNNTLVTGNQSNPPLTTLEDEIERFFEVYSTDGRVFDEARAMWKVVDLERGKGRLRREREKEKDKGKEELAE